MEYVYPEKIIIFSDVLVRILLINVYTLINSACYSANKV